MNIQLNRFNPLNKLGTKFAPGTTMEQAIVLGGLDYQVEKVPLYLGDGTQVEGAFATQKSDDKSILGIVGNQYNIVQNQSAFDFVNDVIGEGATLEYAGTTKDFAQSYMLAKAPERFILNDKYDPYLLFTNSFDGSGSIKVAITPVRVFCTNAIVRALSEAMQKISIRHSQSAIERLQIAQNIMSQTGLYMNALEQEANELASIRISETQFSNEIIPFILHELKLDNAEDRLRNKDRADIVRQDLMSVYHADDLQNFNGSAWKVAQAIGDWESHYEPARNKNNDQIYMQRIMAGMVILNAVMNMAKKRYGMR